MPEFLINFCYEDPDMEESRCLTRFIWTAKSEEEAKASAKAIIEDVKFCAEEDFDCEVPLADIHITVTPVESWLKDLRYRGNGYRANEAYRKKYAFVKVGAKVKWNDPDHGLCSQVAKVTEISEGPWDEDTIVTIAAGTECLLKELEPA
jgi:hypothetical protein